MNMNKLRLSKEIFPIEAIKRATNSYKNIANISIEETEEYYNLAFFECYFPEEKTLKEFENYVIDLMGSKNGK